MIVRKDRLIALAFLGFCLLPLLSCGTPGSGIQSYAQVAPQPPGTARVWFMRTKDPQEQQGDPIIYVNGNPVGRSVGGIAFYHDYPPGTYTFTVQSYGVLASQEANKVTKQLAAGTQTFLEIEWGSSWLVGTVGGDTYFVRPLPPELDHAYLQIRPDRCSVRPAHGPKQAECSSAQPSARLAALGGDFVGRFAAGMGPRRQ
jgi:hypothetical protein